MPDDGTKSRNWCKSSPTGANGHENGRHAQMEIGEAWIEDIEPAPKSRDDMPALLTGLQHPYRNEETREALSALPGGTCCPAGTGTTAVRAWSLGGFR